MTDSASEIKRCKTCILPVGFPGVSFDENGICALCANHKPSPAPLGADVLKEKILSVASMDYDCVVPLSGGKDSSYVLYYAVKKLGLRVLAVNYNSGFQSPQATANVVNACKSLNVPLKVFHANLNLRKSLIRQVLKFGCLTGIPTGVCGNCENAIRSYSIRAAHEAGVCNILLGDSEAEKINIPIPTGLGGLMRRVNAKNFPGVLKALSAYYVTASRERKYMGIPAKEAFSLSMAPIAFPVDDIQVVHFFDYVPWETMNKKELLEKELGWKAACGQISRFDCYLHPLDNLGFLKQLGISKDGIIYANLVRAGIMTREQALEQEINIQKTIRHDCLEFAKQYGRIMMGWIGLIMIFFKTFSFICFVN